MKISNGKIPVDVIPSNWSVVDFKKAFKVNQGLQIPIAKRKKISTNNTYFYITNEFIKNRFNGGKKYYIENPPENVICYPKDILMTRTGNTGIVVTNIEGVFHNNFFKISFDRNILNKDYVYYYLCSTYVQKMIRIYAGSSTIPDLNHSDFYKIKLLKPTLSEQKKIADILSTWDKAIELKQQLIDLKKKQKKGLMQKLLVGEVHCPRLDNSWNSYILNTIGEIFNGLSGKTKTDFGDLEGKPYITYKSIFDDYKIDINKVSFVNIDENENQNEVKFGDVLFTTSSETPHEVGMSAVFLDNIKEVYLNSFSFGYRINDFSVLDPEFAQYLFRGEEFRKVITSIAQGSTRFNLSKKEFKKIKITVPSLKEQYKTTEILNSTSIQIEFLEKELEVLKEQKKGLMQQLLTGKTRVKV